MCVINVGLIIYVAGQDSLSGIIIITVVTIILVLHLCISSKLPQRCMPLCSMFVT